MKRFILNFSSKLATVWLIRARQKKNHLFFFNKNIYFGLLLTLSKNKYNKIKETWHIKYHLTRGKKWSIYVQEEKKHRYTIIDRLHTHLWTPRHTQSKHTQRNSIWMKFEFDPEKKECSYYLVFKSRPLCTLCYKFNPKYFSNIFHI